MAEHTLSWASRLAGKGAASLEVRFDGGLVPEMEAWLGKGFRYVPQAEGDVGARMDRAFREAFSEGIGKAVLIGTDLPELSLFHIREAWKALEAFDVVLGPAADGGYGPIGLRRAVPDLFRGITWSTDQVLKQTLSKAAAAGLKVKVLPALRDVDRPEDLPVWEQVVRQSISIIIPTLNEPGDLARTLRAVGRPADTEVIVADGGSQDETLSIAREAGAKVVSCSPSRGGQLNAGAAAAIGNILLFLHADTRLPEDFARLVRDALRDPEVAGGAFALRFEPCPPVLKINEVTANWRTRLFHLPFGDQAIFVRSSLFRLMGGFRDLPLMEDVDFARRLHRAGRTAFLPAPVLTSSRRYSGGYWRRNLINKVVFAGYFMGVTPERLAKMYRLKDSSSCARAPGSFIGIGAAGVAGAEDRPCRHRPDSE
jgi:rSAM/selenodomain-associated transferase 2/rSAM/selenodomain-associated transferase 1